MKKGLQKWLEREIERGRAIIFRKRPVCSVCNADEAMYQFNSRGQIIYICLKCIIDLRIEPELGFSKGQLIFEESCLIEDQ